MAANNAVLQTTELFEACLTHLSATDLAHSRLVSKRWNAANLTCPLLQPTRFLKPAPSHEVLRWEQRQPDSDFEPRITNLIEHPEAANSEFAYKIVDLHPYFTRTTTLNDPENKAFFFFFTRLEDLVRGLRTSQREPGVWQEQFLTQPPCQDIEIFLLHPDGAVESYAVAGKKESEGLRVRDLKKRAEGLMWRKRLRPKRGTVVRVLVKGCVRDGAEWVEGLRREGLEGVAYEEADGGDDTSMG